MSFVQELKRRNVFRAAAAYIFASWLIIQVIETILPAFGFGDAVVRIAVIVLAIGFIPSVVFAWAFELTPDGFIPDSEVDHTSPGFKSFGKKLDRVVMVVLVLALGYFAFDKFVLDPARDADLAEASRQEGRTEAIIEEFGDKSIAVLPFIDMSQAGDQQYLSDGLAEEMLNLLAQLPELRVASRSSAFSLRDSKLSLPEVAAKLGVSHILEGSVRMAGNQLRVTVQLIEASSDTHRWSQNYDRTFDNVFAIQDDIATNVVEQLKITLLEQQPKSEQVNPEAYNLMLQGRFLMNRLVPEESQAVVELLLRAIEIEPDWYQVWIVLSTIYQRQAAYGLVPKEEALAKSWAALNRAIELRPELPSIQYRMGWMAMRWENDIEKAAYHIQRAVDLTEDPIKKMDRAKDLWWFLGRYELYLLIQEHWVRTAPTAVKQVWGLAQTYHMLGQYQKSINTMQAAMRLSPEIQNGHAFLAESYYMSGQYELALKHALRAKRQEHALPMQVLALDALDRKDEADPILEQYRSIEDVNAEMIAIIHATRGESDQAFAVLDALSPAEDEIGWWTINEPRFAPLHNDLRWSALVKRIKREGFDPDTIELNVPIPEGW